MYYFSTGIYNYWMLTWLAPIPLFIYALRAPIFLVMLAGYITCFFGLSSGIWVYLETIIPIVATLIYGNFINATFFTLLLLLFRYMVCNQKHWGWSLVFASGWTAFEFIMSLHSPAGTIDSIAYTQMYNLSVIQIASVTGIWGITFLVMLIPSSIALSWYYRENKKLSLMTIGFPISILVLTVAFGFYRLNLPLQGPSVKIGMVAIQTSLEEMRLRGQQKQIENIINRYIDNIELLANSGVEVVLLPEKIVNLNLNNHADILRRLAIIANERKILLITGVSIKDDGNLYNSAYLFSENGQEYLKYDKHHLLPFSEGNFIPGNKIVLKETENKGLWGIAICKDMDFEEPSREYGRVGTSLLFVPALDFKADAFLHARVAIMRGVEENYAVARAAQWGILTLSDNRGRIIHMTSNESENGDFLLVGEIPLEQGKSFYSRWGNWFGYFCGSLFLLLLLFFVYNQTVKGHK